MAKKEKWIDANEASAILTLNSGHEVKSDYVRTLFKNGKIQSKMLDGRTRGYLKSEIEAYTVQKRHTATSAT